MRRFGKLTLEWDHNPKFGNDELVHLEEEYTRLQKGGKRLILGTLASRAGTKWLCDIFAAHPHVTGTPERAFEAAAFYRYIKYNKLPIDTSGVIAMIKYWIIQDWKKGDLALVFSPHFSHGLAELYEELKPEKIFFAINDPEFSVQSMYNKGVFKQYYFRKDNDKAIGFQPALVGSWAYNFGRLVPSGPFYDTWKSLTRIGKLAWWGNMVTTEIAKQFSMIPEGVMDIFHLKTADQNYAYYKDLAVRYKLTPLLSEKAFLALKGKRFKQTDNVKHEWSALERAEFETYTKEWTELYKKLCLEAGK